MAVSELHLCPGPHIKLSVSIFFDTMADEKHQNTCFYPDDNHADILVVFIISGFE